MRSLNINRRSVSLFVIIIGLIAAYFLHAAQGAFAQDDLVAGEVATGTEQVTPVKGKKTKYAQVAKVELDKLGATIRNAETVQFSATIIPSIEGKKLKPKDTEITWSVSNPRIARISQDGTVQGKRTGTVRVRATAPNGKRGTALVKVKIDKREMATKIPILTYHRISSNTAKRWYYWNDSLAVSASMFDKQMKWLKENGYTTISCQELRDWRVEGAFLPKKSVLVTMDDGFYETYYVAYPILKKYGQKATSFVIGNRTKARTAKFDAKAKHDRYVGRDVIKEVREEYPNLEFQSHTYNMHYRASSGFGIVTAASRRSIEIDFERNSKFGFTALAYPYGHSSSNMLSVLNADDSINIAFGYMKEWPATRTSPIYNMPRFKVMGNGSMADFERVVETAR